MSIRTRIDDISKNGFYLEEEIRPDLFGEIAQELGACFASKQKGSKKISSNQLRGFFSEVKALEIKLKTMSRGKADIDQKSGISKDIFVEHKYLVQMIVPKVYYIQGKRTGGNVTKEFRDFIEACVDQINNPFDFTIFMRLFESVVGFFYGFGGEDKR